MKTTATKIITGVCEGYGHQNKNESRRCDSFEDLYMKVALQVYKETEIYVSAVCMPCRTLYNSDWGCPDEGEDTYMVTSTRNPEFVQDDAKWRNAVLEIASILKKELRQSTLTLEFTEVELIYIK